MGKKSSLKGKFGKMMKNKQKISKEDKLHNEMLNTNLEAAKDAWKTFVDEMADLGYEVAPTIEKHNFVPGAYAALINLRGMTFNKFDRHKNPEKWAEIDEERKKEAEEFKAKKREEDEAIKLAEEAPCKPQEDDDTK